MFISGNMLASVVDAQVEAVMSRSSVDADTLYDILYQSAIEAIDTVENSMTLAEKVGPCIWKDMHYRAKVADREGRPDLYVSYINNLAESHPCLECRYHMQQNISKYPPSKYSSCFLHSVILHNVVNVMLGKPTMSYEDADQLYNIDCDSCFFRWRGKDSSNDTPIESTQHSAGTRVEDRSTLYQRSGGHSYDREVGETYPHRSYHGNNVRW